MSTRMSGASWFQDEGRGDGELSGGSKERGSPWVDLCGDGLRVSTSLVGKRAKGLVSGARHPRSTQCFPFSSVRGLDCESGCVRGECAAEDQCGEEAVGEEM